MPPQSCTRLAGPPTTRDRTCTSFPGLWAQRGLAGDLCAHWSSARPPCQPAESAGGRCPPAFRTARRPLWWPEPAEKGTLGNVTAALLG